MRSYLLSFFVGLLLVVLFCGVSSALTGDDCSNCHDETVSSGSRARYVHAPFRQQNCSVCHVVAELPSGEKEVSGGQRLDSPDEIDWLQKGVDPAVEHRFLFPARELGGKVFFRVVAGSRRPPVQVVGLPDIGSLPEVEIDRRAPVLSDVRVPDIRRGISTTVTVRWQTDEFTDAEIRYGKEGLASRAYRGALATEHRFVLVGLDANAEYQYQVASVDLFGNRSESAVLRFVTDRTMIEESGGRSVGGRGALATDWKFYRSGDRILLVFTADRPVSLSLGIQSRENVQNAVASKEKVAAAAGHPLLKSLLDTNTTVCYDCHSGFRDGYTHPVNVYPRKGMIIPPDFPLLPNGRISCMSCHSTHAGDFEYRLLRGSKAELCRACHSEY